MKIRENENQERNIRKMLSILMKEKNKKSLENLKINQK